MKIPGLRRALAPVFAVARALLVTGAPARAGGGCVDAQPTVHEIVNAFRLAAEVAVNLDANGVRVAALARAGQDLSRYGLRYSHLGWVYAGSDGEDTVWRVVHKLNHCGAASGALFRQGLAQFFSEQPHEYRAGLVLLRDDVANALLKDLRDNRRLLRMHERSYSVVAYPWTTHYQQSNQWANEVLAGAMTQTVRGRKGAQAWLRREGFRPSVLHISAADRLGGRLTRANIAFDDHPFGDRMRGRIATTTVDSTFQWLMDAGYGVRQLEVRLSPG